MRFKGEESQIRCFGHVLNLVVTAILKDLGSVAYLDRAAEHLAKKSWTAIYVLGAAGVIAKLRLMVLWTAARILQKTHLITTSILDRTSPST
jgi:hypothetical protein